MFIPPRTLHSSGSRFARCDQSRTWNTGSFGPDAIAFSVDRSGIAIAGCMVYSGSGSYEYQLELLYDNSGDVQQPLQHKWETLESVSGTYDQTTVQNDMAEIKFERSVLIKVSENGIMKFRLAKLGERVPMPIKMCAFFAYTHELNLHNDHFVSLFVGKHALCFKILLTGSSHLFG